MDKRMTLLFSSSVFFQSRTEWFKTIHKVQKSLKCKLNKCFRRYFTFTFEFNLLMLGFQFKGNFESKNIVI
jgi:hypothetical protein